MTFKVCHSAFSPTKKDFPPLNLQEGNKKGALCLRRGGIRSLGESSRDNSRGGMLFDWLLSDNDWNPIPFPLSSQIGPQRLEQIRDSPPESHTEESNSSEIFWPHTSPEYNLPNDSSNITKTSYAYSLPVPRISFHMSFQESWILYVLPQNSCQLFFTTQEKKKRN